MSALGESTDRVSMAAARKVFIDGFAGARGACDVLIPQRPLSELFGDELPQWIAHRGVTVRTGSCITEIRVEPEGIEPKGTVRLISQGGSDFLADDVIVAVPWHTASDLLKDHLPSDQINAIKQLSSSPISGVHLWFDREITDRPHTVLVDSLSQWLFRPSRRDHPPSTESAQLDGKYYQVVISASRDVRNMDHAELMQTIERELKEAFPEAGDAQLIHSRVVTDPRSVFSVSPESEAIRPRAETKLPWLHLAGDWVETGWPATMEGAVIGGKLAAAGVVRRHGGGHVDVDSGLPRKGLAGWLIRP